MVRELDLIRHILLSIENQPGPFNLIDTDIAGADFATLANHLELLVEAGLVKAELSHSDGGEPIYVRVHRLTWTGHEFVALAKHPQLWDQALGIVAHQGAPINFELLAELLTQLTRQRLQGDQTRSL